MLTEVAVKNTRGVTWITLAGPAPGGGSFDRASKAVPPPLAAEPAQVRLSAPAEQAAARAQGGAAQPGAPPATVPGQPAPSGLAAMAAARKLIRTGQITLTVESYPKAADE